MKKERKKNTRYYAPYAWDMCVRLLGLPKPCIVNICHGICINDFWNLCTRLCASEICVLIKEIRITGDGFENGRNRYVAEDLLLLPH